MLVVGLVRSGEWDPPDETPGPRPRRTWNVPWRGVAWAAVICALFFVAPVFGGVVGYLVILLAVWLGFSRLERLLSRQYWRGLRDYQA